METLQSKSAQNGSRPDDTLALLHKEAAQETGSMLPESASYLAADSPLCKSGYALADALRPVIPGIARAVDHQTADLEHQEDLAHAARRAAAEELASASKRLEARAVLIRLRQSDYLKERATLQQERSQKRLVFAKAAAALGITLSPDTLTCESVIAALHTEKDYGPRPVPVPGRPSALARLFLTLTQILAPIFCSVPISSALGTLTGALPLSVLQNLDDLSPAQVLILLLFWLIGASLHHVLMGVGTDVGKIHSRATFEGHIPDLPKTVRLKCAAWSGTGLLVLLWVLVSLLEGFGLHQMATDFAFLNSEEAPPLWVFFLIGSAINGAIVTFAGYLSFTDSCRELAETWAWKRDDEFRPVPLGEDLEERKALMTAACELMDMNAQFAQTEARLREDATALAETPQLSAETRQRIKDAQAKVDASAKRLQALLEYASRRMGVLPPLLNMGEVEVPTKLILLPFQKLWLHLRAENHDQWPQP